MALLMSHTVMSVSATRCSVSSVELDMSWQMAAKISGRNGSSRSPFNLGQKLVMALQAPILTGNNSDELQRIHTGTMSTHTTIGQSIAYA
jgi:hypothetical protein